MEVFQGKKTDGDSLDPIKPKWTKKRLIILVLFLTSLIFSILAYVFLINNDDVVTGTNNADEVVPEIKDNPIMYFVYAFGDDDTSPANVFQRGLGADAQRESVLEINSIQSVPNQTFSSNLVGFQASNSFAVIVDNKDIYVRKGEDKAEQIYSHPQPNSNSKIMSAVITRSGEKVAFVEMNTISKTASLWILNVKQKSAEKVKDTVETTPFAWSLDNKNIFLGPNMILTDGKSRVPTSFNIAKNTETPLFDSADNFDFGAYNVSPDGSHSVYVKPTIDKNKKDPSTFQGYYVGKPYKIFSRVLTSGQISEVRDISNDNAPKSLVFDQLSQNIYWSEGNKLMQFSNETGRIKEILQAEEEIEIVYAATSTQVIFSTMMPDKTFALKVVNLEDNKAADFMETTSQTSAIGLIIE